MGDFLALLMFLDSGPRYEMVLHFKQLSQFPEVEQNVEQKSGPFGGTTDKKKEKNLHLEESVIFRIPKSADKNISIVLIFDVPGFVNKSR